MALSIRIKFRPFCERSPPWGGSDWSTTIPYHLNQLLYGGTVEFLDHLNQDLIWEIKTTVFFSFLKASPVPLFSYKTKWLSWKPTSNSPSRFHWRSQTAHIKVHPSSPVWPRGLQTGKGFLSKLPLSIWKFKEVSHSLCLTRSKKFPFQQCFPTLQMICGQKPFWKAT